MKALYFDQQLVFTDRPEPEIRTGEALIRMRMAGICNTDIEITHGYMGFTGILGHEFVGEVIECEDSSWIGRRVVGEINLGCGSCDYCRRQLQRHCPNRTVLGIYKKDGAFAEYLTLPIENLHAVPDTVSDHEAVLTLLGRHRNKLALAENWGIRISPLQGFEVVVEVTGSPEGFSTALTKIKPRGNAGGTTRACERDDPQ